MSVMAEPSDLHAPVKAEEAMPGMRMLWQSLEFFTCLLVPDKLGIQLPTAAAELMDAVGEPSAIDRSNAASQLQSRREFI